MKGPHGEGGGGEEAYSYLIRAYPESCFLLGDYLGEQYAREDAILHAMTVVLYPVSFFVGFLYYTDAGALYLVLVMYTLARRGKVSPRWKQQHLHPPIVISFPLTSRPPSSVQHKWAAFAGLISVLFRQTNVVWVAYILGTCMVDDLASLVGKKETGIATTEFFSRHLLYRFVISVFKERHLLLSHLWPYLVPLSSFVAFLIWNGGSVVVGDKKHHAPVFHFAQLAYFFSIAALTSNSELLMTRRSVTPFWAWVMRQGLVKLVLLLGTAAYLLHYYTLDHPFLLADNRHYTFYIWKRFFQRIPHLNLLLLPFYVFWTWLVLSRIRQATSALSATIFFVAVSLVLLPAQLLEPRYYNIPLTIVLLETPRRSWISLAFSIMCMLVVNAVTIYVFLYRPFTWVDGTTARFMW